MLGMQCSEFEPGEEQIWKTKLCSFITIRHRLEKHLPMWDELEWIQELRAKKLMRSLWK